MSQFFLEIRRYDREPVRLRPGGHAEHELVRAIIEDALRHGVGFWRTKAHVARVLTDAIGRAIGAAKSDVLP